MCYVLSALPPGPQSGQSLKHPRWPARRSAAESALLSSVSTLGVVWRCMQQDKQVTVLGGAAQIGPGPLQSSAAVHYPPIQGGAAAASASSGNPATPAAPPLLNHTRAGAAARGGCPAVVGAGQRCGRRAWSGRAAAPGGRERAAAAGHPADVPRRRHQPLRQPLRGHRPRRRAERHRRRRRRCAACCALPLPLVPCHARSSLCWQHCSGKVSLNTGQLEASPLFYLHAVHAHRRATAARPPQQRRMLVARTTCGDASHVGLLSRLVVGAERRAPAALGVGAGAGGLRGGAHAAGQRAQRRACGVAAARGARPAGFGQRRAGGPVSAPIPRRIRKPENTTEAPFQKTPPQSRNGEEASRTLHQTLPKFIMRGGLMRMSVVVEQEHADYDDDDGTCVVCLERPCQAGFLHGDRRARSLLPCMRAPRHASCAQSHMCAPEALLVWRLRRAAPVSPLAMLWPPSCSRSSRPHC